MPSTEFSGSEHTQYHKDGTLHARGAVIDGEPHGYWEWFRTDGTRKRSGHFDRGNPIGEWTTYDKAGEIYKVTQRK